MLFKKISFMLMLLVLFASISTHVYATEVGYPTKNVETAWLSVKITDMSKSAYVTVSGTKGIMQKIVLRDSNNTWLWEGELGKTYQRKLYLGNDHSSYRIYMKTASPNSVGIVSFKVESNCSINIVYPLQNFQQEWSTGSNPFFKPEQWGSYKLLSKWACGSAAVASALSTWDPSITPEKICIANDAYANNDGSAVSAWKDLGYEHIRSITYNSTSDIDVALENFKNDPSLYSPPIMYLTPSHFVVVVGQDKTSYKVFDPGYPDLRDLPKPANYSQVDQFKR